jgi:Ni,Fe-hydrogenase III small subunit
MIKVYRINTGSCGACDLEIAAAVAMSNDIDWATSPETADAILLTGPLTVGSRAAFMAQWRALEAKVLLLAVGRCAIDGHPYGRGGLADMPELHAILKVDGCPPEPKAIAEAIRTAMRDARSTPPSTT